MKGALMKTLPSILILGSALAFAQDEVEFAETAGASWESEWYADLRLRSDHVRDLPSGLEVDRQRLRFLLGKRWFNDRWELGLAAKLSVGTDDNADNILFLDNEESNELELGDFYVRYAVNQTGIVEAGRTLLPLDLSPMVWDHDLRPTGISYRQDFDVRGYDRISLLAGSFHGLHYDENQTELNALQLVWLIREGAPSGGSVTLSYLNFDDLDILAEDRKQRTNLVFFDPDAVKNHLSTGNRFVHDYELVDLQAEAHWPTAWGELRAHLNFVQNLEVDEQDSGSRLTLTLGDARQVGWEFGYAIQRIQREAVVAALNEDDWWFGSFMRGYHGWIAYGFNENLQMRLAGFVERWDPVDDHNKRLQLDLTWRG